MPKITIVLTSPPKVPANNEPKIGPVQENETIAKVKAMKDAGIYVAENPAMIGDTLSIALRQEVL